MQIYEVSSDPETLRAGKCRKPLCGRIRQAAVRLPGLFSLRMRRFPEPFSLRMRRFPSPSLFRASAFRFRGAGGTDVADGLRGRLRDGLCGGLCDGFCGWLCGWLFRMAFPGASSGRGGARLALACGGQPMSFSSCRSEASGKSVRKWSRMRTNDSAGVQSAISSP